MNRASERIRLTIEPPSHEYDVALSFAGTERHLAEKLAVAATDNGFRVFYDRYETARLWGANLPITLDEVYRVRSKYCVILASQEYLAREWTNHELRSAVERMIQERDQIYLLQVKVDDVRLPGVPGTVAYLSLRDFTIDQVCEILIQRLEDESPLNRAKRIILSANPTYISKVALLEIYRSNPENYDLYRSTVSLWSDDLLRVMSQEFPAELAVIFGKLNQHLPNHFDYRYLNDLARLLGRAYRISFNPSVRHSCLISLLEIGKRFDEIDMGKEFSGLVSRTRTEGHMHAFAQALAERTACIPWILEFLQPTGKAPQLLTAMEGLGVYFVDFGNEESERKFDLQGGKIPKSQDWFPKSPNGDRIARSVFGESGISLEFHELTYDDCTIEAELWMPKTLPQTVVYANNVPIEFSIAKHEGRRSAVMTTRIPRNVIGSGKLALRISTPAPSPEVSPAIYNLTLIVE